MLKVIVLAIVERETNKKRQECNGQLHDDPQDPVSDWGPTPNIDGESYIMSSFIHEMEARCVTQISQFAVATHFIAMVFALMFIAGF